MKPILFCSIQDLADTLFVSNEETILMTLVNAEMPKYRGWSLHGVRGDTGVEELRKEFPLKLEELLPWLVPVLQRDES